MKVSETFSRVSLELVLKYFEIHHRPRSTGGMYRILILSVACVIVASQNATEDTSTANPAGTCAQQMDAWQLCQMKDLPRSPEGKSMKDKIDAIYEKCAGSMPKNCTMFWRTADECFHKELDNIDSDPQASAAKRQTLTTVDQCYQRTPNDPFADLFEELYPEMLLFDDGGLKPPQQIGLGGRKFLPPPQCAPTLDNLQCVSKEMATLAQDSEAKKASMALRKLKKRCNDKLSPECSPQSPPLWMCVDRALKAFTRQTEEAMQKCMQSKGFTMLLRPSMPQASPIGGAPPPPSPAANGMPPFMVNGQQASMMMGGSTGGQPPPQFALGGGVPGGMQQMSGGGVGAAMPPSQFGGFQGQAPQPMFDQWYSN